MSHFDELGGEAPLRAIIDDMMIGFFFAGVDPTRLTRFEFEHAAELLGGPFAYTGRDLRTAHKRHPIMGGQFDRRRQILRNTLVAHGVPEHIREAWLAHQEALRDQVTQDPEGQCVAPVTKGKP
jgi:hemoglobin